MYSQKSLNLSITFLFRAIFSPYIQHELGYEFFYFKSELEVVLLKYTDNRSFYLSIWVAACGLINCYH